MNETKSIDILFNMVIILILMILSSNTNAGTIVIVDETININEDSTREEKQRDYGLTSDVEKNGIFHINITNHATSRSNLSIFVSLANVLLISSTYPFAEINQTHTSNPSNKLKINHQIVIGEELSLRLLRTSCEEGGGLTIIFEIEPEKPQPLNVTFQIGIEEKGDGGCNPSITSFNVSVAGTTLFIILIIIKTNRKSRVFSKLNR